MELLHQNSHFPTTKFKFPIHSHHLHTSNSLPLNGPIPCPSPLTFSSLHPLQNPPFFTTQHLKIHHKRSPKFVQHSSRFDSKFKIRAFGKNSDGPSWASDNNAKLVILSSVVTVLLAVANRVLYKLALVPMKDYPFFLAQLTTFG